MLQTFGMFETVIKTRRRQVIVYNMERWNPPKALQKCFLLSLFGNEKPNAKDNLQPYIVTRHCNRTQLSLINTLYDDCMVCERGGGGLVSEELIQKLRISLFCFEFGHFCTQT